MTAVSCLGVGIAFLIAVALLLLAGIAIGWLLPVKRRRPPGES